MLWKKVKTGLSAGRVQSVAVRLAVERARERIRFVTAEYWDILGAFHPLDSPGHLLEAQLSSVAAGRSPPAGTSPRRAG